MLSDAIVTDLQDDYQDKQTHFEVEFKFQGQEKIIKAPT